MDTGDGISDYSALERACRILIDMSNKLSEFLNCRQNVDLLKEMETLKKIVHEHSIGVQNVYDKFTKLESMDVLIKAEKAAEKNPINEINNFIKLIDSDAFQSRLDRVDTVYSKARALMTMVNTDSKVPPYEDD